jgi:hypothetical protein
MMMTVGQAAMLHPSLAGMVETVDAKISREGLHQRFTASAEKFLLTLLELLLKRTAQTEGLNPTALAPFNRVHIFDSSSWDVDSSLKDVFPGSGGDASDANCKLQAGYEYKTGALGFFAVTEGIKPDQAYCLELVDHIQKGDLTLEDLGYFKLRKFQLLAEKGAFFLSRLLVGTSVFDPATNKEINLGAMLRGIKDDVFELNVAIGADERFPCRLTALRVPKQVANERRRKLKKESKKKGRTPSKIHLALCDWTLFVTNAPAKILPLNVVRSLYRLRWQIELIFKQLKSVLRIHCSNTAKDHRLMCELYGKLIMAVIIHGLHANLNLKMLSTKGREVSFDKFYKRVQERAFALIRNMLISVPKAIKQFLRDLKRIADSCIKYRQPSRKTTFELLDLANDFLHH